jgi:hypothetical protein
MAKNNQNRHAEPELNIELPETIAEGIYSNLVIISHSPSEFVLDFVLVMPNVEQARVKSRIILTPDHAKKLLDALQDNVKKFEHAHGVIKTQQNQNSIGFPINFGGSMGGEA